MGWISFMFSKNNPNELVEKYYYYDKDYKLKTIYRLFELNAIDELHEIKDDMPDVVYPILIEYFKSDSKELMKLYTAGFKKQIVSLLINNKSYDILFAVKDDFPDIIYPVLIENFKTNSKSLMKLYNGKFRQKIVKHLINNNCYELLFTVKDDFPELIYPELIKHYKDDSEKLMNLYKGNFKQDIINHLINNKSYDILEKIKDDFSELIYPELIEYYKDNSEKLMTLYKGKFNQDIINHLINNKSYDILEKIKDDFPDIIYPVLIKHYKDDSEKLMTLYKGKFKQDIVNIFINNNSYDILEKIKEDFPGIIHPVLIKHYIGDSEKLMTLYKGNFKQDIVNHLIKNKSYEILITIKKDFPDLIYPVLIAQYISEAINLKMLLGENHNYDKSIIQIFKEQKEIKILENLKNSYPEQIYPFLIDLYRDDSQKLNSLLGNNYDTHIIKLLLEKNAINELWQNRRKYQKEIYPKLIQHYIDNNKKLLELFNEIDEFNEFKHQILKQLKNNQADEELFEVYQKNKNNKKITNLCYMYINDEKFKDQINEYLEEEFQKKVYNLVKCFNLTRMYEQKQEQIKEKYSLLKMNANSKAEIEKLLNDEKNELRDFSNIIPDEQLSVDSVNGVFFDLSKITESHSVVDNKEKDIDIINEKLKKQLYQNVNPDEIMKLKAQAKKEQELLINKNDLIYTLQNSDKSLADDEHIIDVLSYFLIKYEDLDLRKNILYFAHYSEKHKWLNVLYYIQKIIDSTLMKFLILNLKNKKNVRNLKDLNYLVLDKVENIRLNEKTTLLPLIKIPDIIRDKFYKTEAKDSKGNDIYAYDVESLCLKCQIKIAVRYEYFEGFGMMSSFTSSNPVTEVLEIYDLTNSKKIYEDRITHDRFNRFNKIKSVSFSLDSKYLFYATYDELKIISITDTSKIFSEKVSVNSSIMYSYDSKFLIIKDVEFVKIIALDNFSHTYTKKSKDIESVNMTPNGKFIFIQGKKLLAVISLPDFDEIYTDLEREWISIAISDTSEIYAEYKDSSVKRINVTSQILKPFINSILIEHLIYLYHNATEEDLIHLIEFQKEIKASLHDNFIVLNDLLNEIIDRIGSQSKSIKLNNEEKPYSKDISLM